MTTRRRAGPAPAATFAGAGRTVVRSAAEAEELTAEVAQERDEHAVAAAPEDLAVGDRSPGVDAAAGVERPQAAAGGRVEGEHRRVVAGTRFEQELPAEREQRTAHRADVDDAVGHARRAE